MASAPVLVDKKQEEVKVDVTQKTVIKKNKTTKDGGYDSSTSDELKILESKQRVMKETTYTETTQVIFQVSHEWDLNDAKVQSLLKFMQNIEKTDDQEYLQKLSLDDAKIFTEDKKFKQQWEAQKKLSTEL